MTEPPLSAAKARIAIAPEPVPGWIRAAVEAGGGDLVPPAEAEGLVWTIPRDSAGLDAVLTAAPGIRWVQLPWAGVEEFAAAGVFADGRQWTCGKGVYAEPVAEHALALALAGLRDLPDRVRATSWAKQSGETLFDAPVTILGGGGITESLVRLLEPFRCPITVVRRAGAARPFPGAQRTVGLDDLDDALPDALVVVLALALTPETTGVMNAARLRRMSEKAWLINVARGAHVVTDDLITALREGWIAGAGIDVTDPEPLPDGHPLWEVPNCIITPHCANTIAMAIPHLTVRIRENVRRFGAGEELIGPVDPQAGY